MKRKLITQAQAAEELGVDVTTIRRWLAVGKLDGFKLAGHGVRVDAASLDKLLTPIRSAS